MHLQYDSGSTIKDEIKLMTQGTAIIGLHLACCVVLYLNENIDLTNASTETFYLLVDRSSITFIIVGLLSRVSILGGHYLLIACNCKELQRRPIPPITVR